MHTCDSIGMWEVMTIPIPFKRENVRTFIRIIIVSVFAFALAYMWTDAIESNAMKLLVSIITIAVILTLFMFEIITIPETRFKDDKND